MSEGGQNKGGDTVSPPSRGPRARDVVAARINAELESLGETKQVSGKMIERARTTARLPEETKQRIRDGEMSLTAALRPTLQAPKQDRSQKQERPVTKKQHPTRPRLDDETVRLRAIQAATDYQAMCNAPAGTLNIPLIRRVEKIVEVIGSSLRLAVDEVDELAEAARGADPPLPEMVERLAALTREALVVAEEAFRVAGRRSDQARGLR